MWGNIILQWLEIIIKQIAIDKHKYYFCIKLYIYDIYM